MDPHDLKRVSTHRLGGPWAIWAALWAMVALAPAVVACGSGGMAPQSVSDADGSPGDASAGVDSTADNDATLGADTSPSGVDAALGADAAPGSPDASIDADASPGADSWTGAVNADAGSGVDATSDADASAYPPDASPDADAALDTLDAASSGDAPSDAGDASTVGTCPASATDTGMTPAAFLLDQPVLISSPRLFVVRDSFGLYVLSGSCSHDGCGLTAEPAEFWCPCHGHTFDLNGQDPTAPPTLELQHYALCRTAAGTVAFDATQPVSAMTRYTF
jgi:nitrite reductase/ring-hydroxylating ferredoxin subunit